MIIVFLPVLYLNAMHSTQSWRMRDTMQQKWERRMNSITTHWVTSSHCTVNRFTISSICSESNAIINTLLFIINFHTAYSIFNALKCFFVIWNNPIKSGGESYIQCEIVCPKRNCERRQKDKLKYSGYITKYYSVLTCPTVEVASSNPHSTYSTDTPGVKTWPELARLLNYISSHWLRPIVGAKPCDGHFAVTKPKN